MLRRAHTGAVAKIRAPTTAATRPVRLALRMQSEDDKAKAAGVALFFVGLVWSGFSVFVGVLAGGAAIYAGQCSSQPTESCVLCSKPRRDCCAFPDHHSLIRKLCFCAYRVCIYAKTV